MTLTSAERQQLATLYEMPVWKTFKKKFMEDRQLELAQLSTFAPNWDQLVENRGKVIELKNIHSEMEKNYKIVNEKK